VAGGARSEPGTVMIREGPSGVRRIRPTRPRPGIVTWASTWTNSATSRSGASSAFAGTRRRDQTCLCGLKSSLAMSFISSGNRRPRPKWARSTHIEGRGRRDWLSGSHYPGPPRSNIRRSVRGGWKWASVRRQSEDRAGLSGSRRARDGIAGPDDRRLPIGPQCVEDEGIQQPSESTPYRIRDEFNRGRIWPQGAK